MLSLSYSVATYYCGYNPQFPLQCYGRFAKPEVASDNADLSVTKSIDADIRVIFRSHFCRYEALKPVGQSVDYAKRMVEAVQLKYSMKGSMQ